jgi:glutaminyl-peptide cyclotransferase
MLRHFPGLCAFYLLMGTTSMLLPGFSSAVETPVFDGNRAMELLVEQVEIGPRTPGSQGNLLLRNIIMGKARQGNLRVASHIFESNMPMGNSPVELCNIIVSAGPEGSAAGLRLWLGAHFDTRPICDRDPDPDLQSEPLVGANDGASGVAVLLHLMELLAENPPKVGVDLIFFDGEDSGISGDPGTYCIGSQRLASTLGDFDNPLSGVNCEGLILLDMIGDRDLFIPMEGYSIRNAPQFTQKVFTRALDLGLPAFSMTPGPSVFDDHVPFLQQGIPAVDLIDFNFPHWHTTSDTPDACSPASLQQVGRLVTDLVYNR